MIPLDILAPVKLDKFDCLDRRDPEHMELVSSSVMLMLDLFGLVTSSLSDGGSFLVRLMKNAQLGFVIIFISNDIIISKLHIK